MRRLCKRRKQPPPSPYPVPSWDEEVHGPTMWKNWKVSPPHPACARGWFADARHEVPTNQRTNQQRTVRTGKLFSITKRKAHKFRPAKWNRKDSGALVCARCGFSEAFPRWAVCSLVGWLVGTVRRKSMRLWN